MTQVLDGFGFANEQLDVWEEQIFGAKYEFLNLEFKLFKELEKIELDFDNLVSKLLYVTTI